MKTTLITICIFLLSYSNLSAQEVKNQKWINKANKWNAEQFTIIKKNFGFSASCDTSKIKVVVLQSEYDKKGPDAYKGIGMGATIDYEKTLARTVGVEGCDQKGTYVYTQSGWVLNATTK